MKLAIYDFDGTIFNNETIPFLVKYYSKHNYSKLKLIKFYAKIIKLLITYKLKLNPTIDKEKFRSSAATIFMVLFEDMNEDAIHDFFSKCGKDVVQYFNPKVVESIHSKKSQGYHTVICSGANTLLLGEVAKQLPIDTVIGTELKFNTDGSYDFTHEQVIVTGKNKPIALLNHFNKDEINWTDSYAYGDSYYDYDILTLTNHPVAVTPDDELRKIAVDNNWDIID